MNALFSYVPPSKRRPNAFDWCIHLPTEGELRFLRESQVKKTHWNDGIFQKSTMVSHNVHTQTKNTLLYSTAEIFTDLSKSVCKDYTWHSGRNTTPDILPKENI